MPCHGKSWMLTERCNWLPTYLMRRILIISRLLLRILWQLLHFHQHAVQLRSSLVGIILQDVTDA